MFPSQISQVLGTQFNPHSDEKLRTVILKIKIPVCHLLSLALLFTVIPSCDP